MTPRPLPSSGYVPASSHANSEAFRERMRQRAERARMMGPPRPSSMRSFWDRKAKP